MKKVFLTAIALISLIIITSCDNIIDINPLSDFPKKVIFRGNKETFNNKYYAITRDKNIWVKPNLELTGIDREWQMLKLPKGLSGDVLEIAFDNEYMIAINSARDIYTMNNAMSDMSLFAWQKNWGPPIWLGSGMKLYDGFIKWDWTSVSPATDICWTDPAGNLFMIGPGRCSHIWILNSDGQRISMNDPWLSQDYSYEITTPYRGRFKAVNMSTSGSYLFVINKYGDMFTRFYDFDLGGNDQLFFQYSYYDQRGKLFPKLQLPSPPWIMHPKIKGTITDRISIHRIGTYCVHRTMRVEGKDEYGNTGYYEKDVTEVDSSTAWAFHRTGAPLEGTVIENRDHDSSMESIGENEDEYYSRNMANINNLPAESASAASFTREDWAGELLDFSCYNSPATFRVHVNGASADLLLHTTDTIRQVPIERGLTDKERLLCGNIEIPPAIYNSLNNQNSLIKIFIAKYLFNIRHTQVAVYARIGRIRIVGPTFEWKLEQ